MTGEFDVAGAPAAPAFFSGLDRARLSHGYIFVGSGGVGKKTFARRLAQSLLCDKPKPTLLGYCNDCPGCVLFNAGTHPDFASTEGLIHIGSDMPNDPEEEGKLTSRGLRRLYSLHGYRSKNRVVLLGDVKFPASNPAAANALLAFFEQPPTGVSILLTTDAPGSLLPTIISRFIQVPFGPLPSAAVEAVLRKDGVAPERALVAAEASLGSITRARSVLDGEASGARAASFAWFEAALRGEMPDHRFLALDDRAGTGIDKRARVADLIELVRVAARDWAALALAGDEAPRLAGDQRALVARLPQRSPANIVAVLAGIGDAAGLAATNVSAGLVLDFLRVQLAPPEPAARPASG